MKNKDSLIIFTKNPVAGKVKTRLAKDLGEEKALDIYQFLLKHSHEVTVPLEVSKQVYYSDHILEDDLWNEGEFIKKLQKGHDLGERMENAFKQGFQEGFEKIIIIGTDLYDISTLDIQIAFKALEENDYVIGPALDGGYYLLGMKSLNSELFKNKRWSTSAVFEDSMKDIEHGRVKILPTQNDIDVLDDLKAHPELQKIIKYDR